MEADLYLEQRRDNWSIILDLLLRWEYHQRIQRRANHIKSQSHSWLLCTILSKDAKHVSWPPWNWAISTDETNQGRRNKLDGSQDGEKLAILDGRGLEPVAYVKYTDWNWVTRPSLDDWTKMIEVDWRKRRKAMRDEIWSPDKLIDCAEQGERILPPVCYYVI